MPVPVCIGRGLAVIFGPNLIFHTSHQSISFKPSIMKVPKIIYVGSIFLFYDKNLGLAKNNGSILKAVTLRPESSLEGPALKYCFRQFWEWMGGGRERAKVLCLRGGNRGIQTSRGGVGITKDGGVK